MKSLFFFACLLAVCYQTYGLKQAVATINARGITGTIKFMAISSSQTRIVVNLQGLTGNQGWHVHQLPIDQTISPEQQCLSTCAGPHYDPFNASASAGPDYETACTTSTPAGCEAGDLAGRLGPLPQSGQLNKLDSTGQILLEGLNSIVGRSVVIHEMGTNNNFECGTIRPQEELEGAEVTILQSVFVSPVAGRMYFKQVYGLPDVQIWGKLYYVDDSAATVNHNWHIHRDLPTETYRIGDCGPERAGPHYDPTDQDATSPGYSERCQPNTPVGCEVGDLTGKLDTVNVTARPAPYNMDAFFFTDSLLNLTGVQAVIGRSVVVHVPDRGPPRLACAPLVQAENLTLLSYPVGGALATISQYSRYQDTIISLGDLPSLGIPPSLGTDNADLTILTAAIGPNEACFQDGPGTSAADSTYSPYTVRSGVTTPDGFALGDLSGAYKDEVTSNTVFSVFDLPVFGARTTITGHVVRYIYGNRRRCVPLLYSPASFENLVTERASFGGGDIGGNIFFFQERVDDTETGSTIILVDIYYLNGTRQRTSTHNWHVHRNASVAGQTCSDVIDGHYNPFSVSLAKAPEAMNSDYSVDCTGNYQLRCESGDMSGKHGQLEIAAFSDENRPTYAYVDNNLELGGAYTINGRSVGLHLPTSAGGALFDCATITPFATSLTTVTAYTLQGDYTTRAELVMKLTANAMFSANDIIVLGQNVTDGCVATVMRTMGLTQNAANSYVSMLSTIVAADFRACGVSTNPVDNNGAHLPLLSPLLLLLPLLLVTLL